MKLKNMDIGTFGSAKQYKMLEFLTEKISVMDEKYSRYISSLITKINIAIKKTDSITDPQFKIYVLSLISTDLKNKINKVNYDPDGRIKTYLLNYLNAKIRNSNPQNNTK